jgi:hypothetical protein
MKHKSALTFTAFCLKCMTAEYVCEMSIWWCKYEGKMQLDSDAMGKK